MSERDQLTLDYLNNLDRIKVLKQKAEDDIITGKEIIELINLYRVNYKIKRIVLMLLERW